MATFTVNSTIGDNATDLRFIDNTNLWAGGAAGVGTFVTDEELQIRGGNAHRGVVLTARDSTIITPRLGLHERGTLVGINNGTFNFRNVTVDVSNTTGGANLGGSGASSYVWEDVKVLYDRAGFGFFGNFDRRETASGIDYLPIYTFNGVQFEGNADNVTADEAFLNLLSATIDTNSVFNNVSFWNGETGANASGGVLQGSGSIVYNNTIIGPFGSNTNNADPLIRTWVRFTNQQVNAIDSTILSRHNTAGLANNFDFRALSQANNTTDRFWMLDIDEGAHMVFNNWLPGRPNSVGTIVGTTPTAGFAFGSFFTTEDGSGGIPATLAVGGTFGGRGQVFISTNPAPGAGDHTYTFNTTRDITGFATGNNGILIPTSGVTLLPGTTQWNTGATWGTTTSPIVDEHPDFITTNIIDASDAVAGLWFRNQHYLETNETQVAGDLAGLSSFNVNIEALATDKSYRKYSWLQQPNNTTWGKLVSISVPVLGATDAEVETARAGGYDLYNGTTWDTSTDISDEEDTIITSLGTNFNTVVKARTELDTTGGTETGAQAIAATKVFHYDNIAPGTTNTQDTLPYFTSGGDSIFSYGSNNIIFSDTATNVNLTGTTYTIPTSNLEADAVTEIQTTGNTTIAGDVLDGTTNKIKLTAARFILDTDPTIVNAEIESTGGDIGAGNVSSATADLQLSSDTSVVTSSANIFADSITDSIVTSIGNTTIYDGVVRRRTGTQDTTISANTIAFINATSGVTGAEALEGAPRNVNLIATTAINSIPNTDYARITPRTGTGLSVNFTGTANHSEITANTIAFGSTVSNSTINTVGTTPSITTTGVSSNNMYTSPTITLNSDSTDDTFNDVLTLTLGSAFTRGTATNNIARATNVNFVEDSSITTSGNITFGTSGDISLTDTAQDVVINSTGGNIVNVGNVTGFFDATSGVAENVTLTADDDINSNTSNGTLTNATLTATNIGTTNAFGDIKHSTLTATGDFTSGGDILRDLAAGNAETNITADEIDLGGNNVNATAGVINITSTNTANALTDISIDNVGDVTNSVLTASAGRIRFASAATITGDDTIITAPLVDLRDNTTVSGSAVITSTTDDIINVGVVAASTLNSAQDISLGAGSDIQTGSTLTARDIDLNDKNIAGSTITASRNIIDAANFTNNATITGASLAFGTVSSDVSDSTVTITNAITGLGDVTDSTVESTAAGIAFYTTTRANISGTTVIRTRAGRITGDIDLNGAIVDGATITNTTADARVLNLHQVRNNALVNIQGAASFDFDNACVVDDSTINAFTVNLTNCPITDSTINALEGVINAVDITNSTVTVTTGSVPASGGLTASGSAGTIDSSTLNIFGNIGTAANPYNSIVNGTSATAGNDIFIINSTNSQLTAGDDITITGNVTGNSLIPSLSSTLNATDDISVTGANTTMSNTTATAGGLFHAIGAAGTNNIRISEGTNITAQTAVSAEIFESATTNSPNAFFELSNTSTNSYIGRAPGSTVDPVIITRSVILYENDVDNAQLTITQDINDYGNITDSTISVRDMLTPLDGAIITNTTFTKLNDLISNNTVLSAVQANDAIAGVVIDGAIGVTTTTAGRVADINSGSIINTSANMAIVDTTNSQLTAENIDVSGDITGDSLVPSLASSLTGNQFVRFTQPTTGVNKVTGTGGSLTITATAGDITNIGEVTDARLVATASGISFDADGSATTTIITANLLDLNRAPIDTSSIVNIAGPITNARNITDSTITTTDNTSTNSNIESDGTFSNSTVVGEDAITVDKVENSSNVTAEDTITVQNTGISIDQSTLNTTTGNISIRGSVTGDANNPTLRTFLTATNTAPSTGIVQLVSPSGDTSITNATVTATNYFGGLIPPSTTRAITTGLGTRIEVQTNARIDIFESAEIASPNAAVEVIGLKGGVIRRATGSTVNPKITAFSVDLNGAPVENAEITITGSSDVTGYDSIKDSIINTTDLTGPVSGAKIENTTFTRIKDLISNNTELDGVTALTATGDFGNISTLAEHIISATSSNIVTTGDIIVDDITNSTLSSADMEVFGTVIGNSPIPTLKVILNASDDLTFRNSDITGISSNRVSVTALDTISGMGDTSFVDFFDGNTTPGTTNIGFDGKPTTISETNIGTPTARVDTINFNDGDVVDNSRVYAEGAIGNLGDVGTNSEVFSNTSILFDPITVASDIQTITGNGLVSAPTINLRDSTVGDTVLGGGRVVSTTTDITNVEIVTSSPLIRSVLTSARDVTGIKEITDTTITAVRDIIWETEGTAGDNKSTRSIVTADNDIDFRLADIVSGDYTADNDINNLDNIGIGTGNDRALANLIATTGGITFTGTGNSVGSRQFETFVSLRAEGTSGSITGNNTDVTYTDIRTPVLTGINEAKDGSVIRVTTSAAITDLISSTINDNFTSGTSAVINIGNDVSGTTTDPSIVTNVDTLNVVDDIINSNITATETVNINTAGTTVSSVSGSTITTTNSDTSTIDGGTAETNFSNSNLEAHTISDVNELSSNTTFKATNLTAASASAVTGTALFTNTPRTKATINFSGNVDASRIDLERTEVTNDPTVSALITDDVINVTGNVTGGSILVADDVTISGSVTGSTLAAETLLTVQDISSSTVRSLASTPTATMIANGIINDSNITATTVTANAAINANSEINATTVNANDVITNSDINAITLNATDTISGSETDINVSSFRSGTTDIVNVNNIGNFTATDIGNSFTTGLNDVNQATVFTYTSFINSLTRTTVRERALPGTPLAPSTLRLNNGDIASLSDVSMDVIEGVKDINNSTVIGRESLTVNGTITDGNINIDDTGTRTQTGTVNITGLVTGSSVIDGSTIDIIGNIEGTTDIDSASTVNVTGNIGGTATVDSTNNITIIGDIENTSTISSGDELSLTGTVKNSTLASGQVHNVGAIGDINISRNITNVSTVKQLSDEFTYTFAIDPSLAAGNKLIHGITVPVTAGSLSASGVAAAFAASYNSSATEGTATVTSNVVVVTNVELSQRANEIPAGFTTVSGSFDANRITTSVVNTQTNTINLIGAVMGNTVGGSSVDGNIINFNDNSIVNANITADASVTNKATLLNLKESTGDVAATATAVGTFTVPTPFDGMFTTTGTITGDLVFTGILNPSLPNPTELDSSNFEFADSNTIKYIGNTLTTGDEVQITGTTTPETVAGYGGFISTIEGRYITPNSFSFVETTVSAVAVSSAGLFTFNTSREVSEGSTYTLSFQTLGSTGFTTIANPIITRTSATVLDILIPAAVGTLASGTTFRLDIVSPKKIVDFYFSGTNWSELFIQNGRVISTQTLTTSEANDLNASTISPVPVEILTAANRASADDVLTNQTGNLDSISGIVFRDDGTGNLVAYRIDKSASTPVDGTGNIEFTISGADLPPVGDNTILGSGTFQFKAGDIIQWTDQVVRVWSRSGSIPANDKLISGYHPNIEVQATATFRLLNATDTPNPYLSPTHVGIDAFGNRPSYSLFDRVSDNNSINWRTTKELDGSTGAPDYSAPGVRYINNIPFIPGSTLLANTTFGAGGTINLVNTPTSPNSTININTPDIWSIELGGFNRTLTAETLPIIRRSEPVVIPASAVNIGEPSRVFIQSTTVNDETTAIVLKSEIDITGFTGNFTALNGTFVTTSTRPIFDAEVFSPSFSSLNPTSATEEELVGSSAVYEQQDPVTGGTGVYLWNRFDSNANRGGWHISSTNISTTGNATVWASFDPAAINNQEPIPPTSPGDWELYDNITQEASRTDITQPTAVSSAVISVSSSSSGGFTNLSADQLTRINANNIKVNEATGYTIERSFITSIINLTSLDQAIPTGATVTLQFRPAGSTGAYTTFTGAVSVPNPISLVLSGGALPNVGDELLFNVAGFTFGPSSVQYASNDSISFSLIKNITEDFTFNPVTNEFIYVGRATGASLQIPAGSGVFTFEEGSWEESPNIVFAAYDYNPDTSNADSSNKANSVIFDTATGQPRILASNTTGLDLSVTSSDTTFGHVLVVATGLSRNNAWDDFRQSFEISDIDTELRTLQVSDPTATARIIALTAQGYQSGVSLTVESGTVLSTRVQVGRYNDTDSNIDTSFTPDVYDTTDQELAIGISGTSSGIPSVGQMNRLIIETVKNTYVYNALVSDIGRPNQRDIIFSQGPQNPVSLHPAYTSFISTERTSQSIGYIDAPLSSDTQIFTPVPITGANADDARYHPGEIVRLNGRFYKALVSTSGSKTLATDNRLAPTIAIDPDSGLISAIRTELEWDPVSQTKTRVESLYLDSVIAGLQVANREEFTPSDPITDSEIATVASPHLTVVSYPVLVLPLTAFDPNAVESTVREVLTTYKDVGVASVDDVTSGGDKLDQILAEINVNQPDQSIFERKLGEVAVDNGLLVPADNPVEFEIPSRAGDIFTAEFRSSVGGAASTVIQVPSFDLIRIPGTTDDRASGAAPSVQLEDDARVQYIGSGQGITDSNNQQAAGATWTFTRHRPIAAVASGNSNALNDLLGQITIDSVRTFRVDLTTPRTNPGDAANTFSISQYNIFPAGHSGSLSDVLTVREAEDIASALIPNTDYTVNAAENTITFAALPQIGGTNATEVYVHVFNNTNLSRILRSIDIEQFEDLTSNIDDLERRIKSVIFPLY